MQRIYPAVIAECIEPSRLDPGACERQAGVGALTIDKPDEGSTGFTAYAFVRFDVAPWLADVTIDAVALRMVVTTGPQAASAQSGEVWRVAPFTQEDLTGKVPIQVGQAPIAPDHGPVVQNERVEWPLPTDVLDGSGVLALGIFPVSSDGVDYWKLNGPAPPELLVVYH
jgi:hypothetical protein